MIFLLAESRSFNEMTPPPGGSGTSLSMSPSGGLGMPLPGLSASWPPTVGPGLVSPKMYKRLPWPG